MIRAMLWKEWREQRWRFALALVVMTTLSASLVRAQLIGTTEALIIVFGPVGLAMALFLAMGPVATERTDRTWTFLTSRPIRKGDILRVKWFVGALQVVVVFAIAGAAAHLAAYSRGVLDLPPAPEFAQIGWGSSVAAGSSARSLWTVVLSAGVAMLAWYTVLFFALARARNDLHAALGGILLTVVLLAWVAHYLTNIAKVEELRTVLTVSVLFNPISPLVLLIEPARERVTSFGIALVLWTALPVWLAGRLETLGSGR